MSETDDFYKGISPREVQARFNCDLRKQEALKHLSDKYFSELKTECIASATSEATAAGLDPEDAVALIVVILFYFNPVFISPPTTFPDSYITATERKKMIDTIMDCSIPIRSLAANVFINQVDSLWQKYGLELSEIKKGSVSVGCAYPYFTKQRMEKAGVI